MDGYTAMGFMILGLAFIFYMLPAIIANTRHTGHQFSIFVVNLVFGWTILGWIAALIWAVVEAPPAALPSPPLSAPHAHVEPGESGRMINS